jgi:hypothetical protein
MKASNAVAKLEKAGFTVITNDSYYTAKKADVIVEFVASQKGEVKTRGFSWKSGTSCATTYGMSLAQVTA